MGPTKAKAPPKNQTKKEVLKDTIDEITYRRTFEPYNKPSIGCRFLRMSTPGQSVTGRLGFPIKNFQQSTSYPLQLDNDEIIEILGNRLLHKQIREGELCGQRIEIVYQGREYTRYGHYRKIYRLYKIGEDQWSQEDWQKIIKKLKRSKENE